ncbi:hypothetical protein F5X99DRAFT_383772 [Biscogniauxia marginata]|nr:hypothetical protein F5X99DRAFT_383772 [Biscogniauxia marginata]
MNDTFHWKLDGLDKQRFEAYTKILNLRYGGQASDPTTFDPDDQEPDTIDPPGDGDSVAGQQLTHFGEDKLKRAILDRLSEVLSSKRGGHQVAAALMTEIAGTIEITVAKNGGMKQKDKVFTERLEQILRKIAVHEDCDASNGHEDLWDLLIDQYMTRINEYILDLRQAFSQIQIDRMKQPLPETKGGLMEHIDTLSYTLHHNATDIKGIILGAYEARKLYSVPEFEAITPKRSQVGRKIGETIHLLGRLRGAFWTLIRAAERIEGFNKLHIRCVELQSLTEMASSNKKKLATRAWTVGQAFKSLGLQFTNEQTRSLMSSEEGKVHINTRDKLVSRFDKLKAPDDEIHAEVQLVLDLARRAPSFDRAFKYIGCSKRSCLLCTAFISTVGSFTSRGCHGKVYGLWTVPELNGLHVDAVESIYSAVKKLEGKMSRILLKNQDRPIAHAKESTVGGSSIATTVPAIYDRHIAALIANRLRVDRERARLGVSIERPISPQHDVPPDEQSFHSRTTERPETQGECAICTELTERHCSSCGRDWYCSSYCQEQMGVHHLFKCNSRPITTADYLYENCIADDYPDDPDVLEDFGFNRCKTHYEKTNLLGVYIGLFKFLDVQPDEVDVWRRENSLLKNITRLYEEIPEVARGGYFPWLLRNPHVLSQDKPTGTGEIFGTASLEVIIEAARPYLNDEDRKKAVEQLEPSPKRYCFFFFAMALDCSHPPPIGDGHDFWYNFGFPACIVGSMFDLSPADIRHAEGRLGAFYSRLFCGHKPERDRASDLGIPYEGPPDPPTCSFDEFWKAWNLSILPVIFDKYGHGDMVDQRWPHLRKYLYCRPQEHPLVWRLCHYIAIDDVNAVDSVSEIKGAAEAYGIHSYFNARDRLMMYEFYRRLLGVADPLLLDDACQTGKLLQFSQGHLGRDMDSQIRSILARLDVSKRI